MNSEAAFEIRLQDFPLDCEMSADFHAYRACGHFSTKTRSSMNCVLTGINARGIYLKTHIRPETGEDVDAVFEHIGRLRGAAEHITEDGFFASMPPALMEGLVDQVIWLKTAETQRRQLRIRPRESKTSIRINGAHASHPATIVDFSLSGASVESETMLHAGDKVLFPKLTHGKVVWASESGRFGIEFDRAFRPTEFSWNTKL